MPFLSVDTSIFIYHFMIYKWKQNAKKWIVKVFTIIFNLLIGKVEKINFTTASSSNIRDHNVMLQSFCIKKELRSTMYYHVDVTCENESFPQFEIR